MHLDELAKFIPKNKSLIKHTMLTRLYYIFDLELVRVLI